MAEKKIHEGRNVKRFREMLGIKQDALAWELGEDWNQQRISLLEQKMKIEDDVLERISSVLKIPVEAIRNLDEDAMINIISGTVNNHDQSSVFNYHPVFNPIEKWLETLEEVRRLNAEVIRAKDEQIQVKQAYIQRLEKMLHAR